MNFTTKKQKGFTLIEIILVIFIFSLVMASLAGIFSGFFGGYRTAKVTQKDLEDAQFIMNQMTKILRTSSLVSGSADGIKIYDYSLNKCYQYRFYNHKMQISFSDTVPANTADPISWCSGSGNFSSYKDIAAFYITEGRFSPISSSKDANNKKLGKVTISMELCREAECLENRIIIQSSVSLRDYYNAGI